MNASNPRGEAKRRRVAILGSTGSIGRQALDVVRRHPDHFEVSLLTAGSNVELLAEQAAEFGPDDIIVADSSRLDVLRSLVSGNAVRVHGGPEALADLAGEDHDLVLAAVVGYAGLDPVLTAAERGTDIALANKEALVVAGSLLMDAVDRSGSRLIPVDSEHSAIFQCLVGEAADSVDHLVLTASGGPFRNRPLDTFGSITRAEALAHPNWSMGQKITIDSATMMNKGLEVIEAHWLFGFRSEKIKIVIHPQSIIHSMVAFVDGSIKAQLSTPDMQLPIQYALGYPDRLFCERGRIDWHELSRLDFSVPDRDRFPCLSLAYEALDRGATAPATLNAANEEAVALFLEGRIAFSDISTLIAEAVDASEIVDQPSLQDLRHADAEGRRHVKELKQAVTN